MGVGAEANTGCPELWDGRYYLSVGSAPGPNSATNFGHCACFRVSGGGTGDEGITAAQWASITSAAATGSTLAMAQAINATPAAAWWSRAVAAATQAGLLTDMRNAVRARYAAWDGVSLASVWVTA